MGALSWFGQFGVMAQIAGRDLRGGLQAFAVFVAALMLGVAAVAAVGTISTAVDQSVARDARALNGGDVVLRQRNAAIDPEVVASVLPQRVSDTPVVRTNAYVAADNGRRLVVGLKAVGDAYPLVGAVMADQLLDGEPARALTAAELQPMLADFGALAEPALMTRLGIAPGDQLELGDIKVTVRGEIVSEPDRLGGFVSIGPRLLVNWATVDAANILVDGALARFSHRYTLPAGIDVEAAADSVREAYPDARFRTRTFNAVQPRVQRLTNSLETYLTLAAVAALLTGGFAVGLAIQAYLASKQRTIAAMRSQGATRAQIMQIYSLQVAAIVAVGTGLGLILGFLIPWTGTSALDQLVPANLTIRPNPAALVPAAVLGALTAAIFAVLPLARASDMPAAQLFRSYLGKQGQTLRWRWYGVFAVIVVALALAVALAVPQAGIALIILGAIAVIGVLLAAAGAGILTLLSWGRRLLPADFRTAAGSLTGPGNNSLPVVIGLGFGLAALIAIALIEANLVREIFGRLPDRAPAMVLIDVQKDQRDAVTRMLTDEADVEILQAAPIVRARVVRIKDVPVEELTLPDDVRWTINSDRGLSYGDPKQSDIPLVDGTWWADDYAGPLLVSVEDEVAFGYDVWVGDTISFNIAGRVMTAEIANIREEIDWGEGRLNFIFLTSNGVIAQAPQTIAMSVDVPRAKEAWLLDQLAEQFPNVTPINIRDVVAQVNAISSKLGYAVRGIAAVTLFSGILVVAAAVQVSYRNRLRDLGIMRAIGATRGQARAMVLAEHGLMAAVASLPALIIGGIGAWAIVRFVLNLEWQFATFGVVAVLAVALLISLAFGLIMVTRLLGRTTASILRQY